MLEMSTAFVAASQLAIFFKVKKYEESPTLIKVKH